MLTTTSSDGQTSTGVSTWGFVIFFLLLFWFWGGNGFGFGNRAAGVAAATGAGMGIDSLTDTQAHCHQNERDLLAMGTTISEQTAAISSKLAEMAYAQEAQTARILDGQKDLYIRDLERIATQQFVTGQTTALTNRLDSLEASAALARQQDTSAAALQRQADQAALSAQIAGIQSSMLKAPAFMPYGGLQTIGCANYGCGCTTCNS